MSILFMLKRKLDRWVYGFNTMKAFHFISEYRRNSIIDISFSEKGFSGKVARPFFFASSITILAMTAETSEPIALPKPVGFEAKR